jgi:hypothetical protein
MNIIEHVWAYLKIRVYSSVPAPTTRQGLWEAVLDEWLKIPLLYIRALYNSIPNRLEALRKARGKNTKY